MANKLQETFNRLVNASKRVHNKELSRSELLTDLSSISPEEYEQLSGAVIITQNEAKESIEVFKKLQHINTEDEKR